MPGYINQNHRLEPHALWRNRSRCRCGRSDGTLVCTSRLVSAERDLWRGQSTHRSCNLSLYGYLHPLAANHRSRCGPVEGNRASRGGLSRAIILAYTFG